MGIGIEEIFQAVIQKIPPPPVRNGFDIGEENEFKSSYDRFINLVKRMWQETPEDRPNFEIIVQELDQNMIN